MGEGECETVVQEEVGEAAEVAAEGLLGTLDYLLLVTRYI